MPLKPRRIQQERRAETRKERKTPHGVRPDLNKKFKTEWSLRSEKNVYFFYYQLLN